MLTRKMYDLELCGYSKKVTVPLTVILKDETEVLRGVDVKFRVRVRTLRLQRRFVNTYNTHSGVNNCISSTLLPAHSGCKANIFPSTACHLFMSRCQYRPRRDWCLIYVASMMR